MSKIPKNIAIIMDGNRRWATRRGLKVSKHIQGVNSLKKIVKYCSLKNIKQLTVFAFSTENWKRTTPRLTP